MKPSSPRYVAWSTSGSSSSGDLPEVRDFMSETAWARRCGRSPRTVAAQDIDAFIVVTKGSSRIGDSNTFVSGLGILEGDSLVMHMTNVFALYWVTVVDARQFTVIGNMAAGRSVNLSAMSAIPRP